MKYVRCCFIVILQFLIVSVPERKQECQIAWSDCNKEMGQKKAEMQFVNYISAGGILTIKNPNMIQNYFKPNLS